jgi:hypothetical protein
MHVISAALVPSREKVSRFERNEGAQTRCLHALVLEAPPTASRSTRDHGLQTSWRVILPPFGPVTVNARPPRKSMVTLALVPALVRSRTISPL